MNEQQRSKWEENQERLFRFMELPFPYTPPPKKWAGETNPSKILSLADPHDPYSCGVVLSHVMDYERDAHTIIVPGDIGDYYSKSRFRKTRHQSFSYELKSVFIRLEWLSTHWKNVKVMLGNHDNRPEKHASALIGNEVDILIMTEQNMLAHLISFFPNVELVGKQLDSTDINLTHIYQHGDIIFTHGELSVTQGTAILDRVQGWLDKWAHVLELKPYRVLAQAHNHRDLEQVKGTVKRMLLPTASNPYSAGMEYIYTSRMIGDPPSIGYTVLHQEDGRTDFNRSHNVVFEIKDGRVQPLR